MSDLTTPTSTADVVVIGGGMAGLAGALALRENGARVTLLEQAPEFGEVGAGLQMAPNATRLLRRWGLLDRVLELGVTPKQMVFRDAVSGDVLARHDLQGEFARKYDAPYIVIHRSDLHTILLEACRDRGVELIVNTVVDRVETVDNRARAITTTGDVYEGDIVLGADGLKSKLRATMSDDEPVVSSYVAYRGVSPIENAINKDEIDNVTVWFGPNCHLVQYPLRHGELFNTVAVFKSSSFEAGEAEFGGVEELKAAYADCVPEVQQSLENLWQGIRWPMFDRNPIDNWISGRALLIGDAAHPMLQYLAQGACQALEDAATLQDLSKGTVFTEDGLKPELWDQVAREFVEVRAPRTARVQRTARVWGESWHVTEPMTRLLRNLLFKSSEADLFRYTDWVYDTAIDSKPRV
jgi:2-polyprenyl-6-methoxyphenol hydroxylase-like FAD-dependent oxidoreductase